MIAGREIGARSASASVLRLRRISSHCTEGASPGGAARLLLVSKRKLKIGGSSQVEMSDWLSPAQAARILGVTTARLRQLAISGRVPYEQTPLGRLYRRSVIAGMARPSLFGKRRPDESP